MGGGGGGGGSGVLLEREQTLSHSLIWEWSRGFYEQNGWFKPNTSVIYSLSHRHAKNGDQNIPKGKTHNSLSPTFTQA